MVAKRKSYVEKASQFDPMAGISVGLEGENAKAFNIPEDFRMGQRKDILPTGEKVTQDYPIINAPMNEPYYESKRPKGEFYSSIPSFIQDSANFEIGNFDPVEIKKGEQSFPEGYSYLNFLPDLVASAGPSLLSLLGGASADVVSDQFNRGNKYAMTRAEQEIPTSKNTGTFLDENGNPELRLIKESIGRQPYSKSSESSKASGSGNLHSVVRGFDPKTGSPRYYFMTKDMQTLDTGLEPFGGFGSFTSEDPYGTKTQVGFYRNDPRRRVETGRTEGFGTMVGTGIPEQTLKNTERIAESYDKAVTDIKQKATSMNSMLGAIDDPNSTPRELAALSEGFIRAVTPENRLSDFDMRELSGNRFKTFAQWAEDIVANKVRGGLSDSQREDYKRLAQRLFQRYREIEEREAQKALRRGSFYPKGEEAIKGLVSPSEDLFESRVSPSGPSVRTPLRKNERPAGVQGLIQEVEDEFGIGTPETRAVLNGAGIKYDK